MPRDPTSSGQAQLVPEAVSPQQGIIGPYPQTVFAPHGILPHSLRVAPHPSSLLPHTAIQISALLGS